MCQVGWSGRWKIASKVGCFLSRNSTGTRNINAVRLRDSPVWPRSQIRRLSSEGRLLLHGFRCVVLFFFVIIAVVVFVITVVFRRIRFVEGVGDGGEGIAFCTEVVAIFN